jgi:hypothetical protein
VLGCHDQRVTEWAVTVNVGGAFMSSARQDSMLAWSNAALAREPAFVFAQEVPSEAWLSVWTDAKYQPVLGLNRRWAVRSALLVRSDLEIEPLTTPESLAPEAPTTLGYHGSYVAVARWNSAEGAVLLASVHASPNEAEPERFGWDGPDLTSRGGGGDPRYPGGRLWDSDLLLHTLSILAGDGPLLAAGDLNEAQDFDIDEHGSRVGTWGHEYFQRAGQQQLTAWLHEAWGSERPTHKRLQLDHILLSESARGLLIGSPEPHLDQAWSSDQNASTLGDHVPIWFALDSGWFA